MPEGVLIDPWQPGPVALDVPALGLESLLRGALVPADEGVGVEEAVQVTDLVLQAAGEKAVAFDGHRLAVFVDAGHACPIGAAGGEGVAGDGEAAFLVLVLIGHGFRDFAGFQHRVDDGAAAHRATLGSDFFLGALLAVGSVDVWAVVDEESLGDPHLVACQANAVGAVHGFVHVRDELLEFLGGDAVGVEVWFPDLVGGVVQDGIASDDDGQNSHGDHFRVRGVEGPKCTSFMSMPASVNPEKSALSERERAMLEFERQWWRHPGAKGEAIQDRFGVKPVRYFQQLNRLIEKPEALDFDPVLVRTLLRRREE